MIVTSLVVVFFFLNLQFDGYPLFHLLESVGIAIDSLVISFRVHREASLIVGLMYYCDI